MSMVENLSGMLFMGQQSIDAQIASLHSYCGEIDKVIALVNTTVTGSAQQFDSKMLNQLQTTKADIEECIITLETAREQLMNAALWF